MDWTAPQTDHHAALGALAVDPINDWALLADGSVKKRSR